VGAGVGGPVGSVTTVDVQGAGRAVRGHGAAGHPRWWAWRPWSMS